MPATRLEVQFPGPLVVAELEAVAGWGVTPQSGSGGRVVGAVWEGGRIGSGQFVEFGVLARNPDTATDLTWRTIQTYEDGSEVQWIGPPDAAFPAAVTRVRAGSVIGLTEWLAASSLLVSLAALSLVWLTRRRAACVSYRGERE